MRNIIDLYEASILDIEGTIEDGNKYENVDLEMIMKAKSEEEFNMLYDILKDTITLIDGRGGGSKFLAQGGGKNSSNLQGVIDYALRKVSRI